MVSAEDDAIPPDLAQALSAIAQRNSPARAPGGFAPGPVQRYREFDVVDRYVDPRIWLTVLAQDTRLGPRVVALEKVMHLAASEERRLMLRQNLFDGEQFHYLTGCIGHTETVGGWALMHAWPTLSDEQHWLVIRDWLTHAAEAETWRHPGRWQEIGALLRQHALHTRLSEHLQSDVPMRQQAALLLWLMTTYDDPHDPEWQKHLPQALEMLATLARDPDPRTRQIAVRAWSDASGPSWRDPATDARAAQRQQLLKAACADDDLSVALDAALLAAAPCSPYLRRDPTLEPAWLGTLSRLERTADLKQIADWLQELQGRLAFRGEVLPISAHDLLGDVALRMLQTTDYDLRQLGARLALHCDHDAAITLALSLAQKRDIVDPELIQDLIPYADDEELRRHLIARATPDQLTRANLEWVRLLAPATIPSYFSALDADDHALAQETYLTFATLGEPWVVDGLVARLDDHPDLRAERRQALSRFRLEEPLMLALRRRLHPGDPLRTSALLVLARLDRQDETTEIGNLLRSVLLDHQDPQRAAVAATLREIWSKPPEAPTQESPGSLFVQPDFATHRAPLRALLKKIISDPDANARAEFLHEVSQHRAYDSVDTILAMLTDPDAQVRSAAREALRAVPEHLPEMPAKTAAADDADTSASPSDAQPRYTIPSETLRAGLTAADSRVSCTVAELLLARMGDDHDVGLKHLLAHRQYDVISGLAADPNDLLRIAELTKPEELANHPELRIHLWELCQSDEQFPISDVAALADASRIVRDRVWPTVRDRLTKAKAEVGFGTKPPPFPSGYEAAVLKAHAEAQQRDLEMGLRILGLRPAK